MNKSIAPFAKGQKVVCIDNGYRSNSMSTGDSANELEKDKIYTVYEMIEPIFDEWGVVLVEVKSPHWSGGFLHTRFAPITSTFIAISYSKVAEQETVGAN